MALTCKAFGDIITFTRTSSATFTGSNGLIQSATTNTPRFDYDPVTLAAKGLLIEEQRTNLCLYSAGVGGTGWSLFGTGTGVTPVITTNFAVAPDGTTTASRVQVSLGGGTASADQSITTQALTGTSCRGSFYIKTNDGSSKTIYVRGTNSFSIVVDGTWRRYDFDAGTLSFTQFGIGLRGGQVLPNDNTADLLVWGAQLEAGSFPTSYIPTVASQVTRSADVASVNTLSPWYNAAEGTIFADYEQNSSTQSGGSLFVQSDGTNNNRILLTADGASSGTIQPGLYVTDASVPQVAIVAGTGTVNSLNKIAAAYKANDFAASFNGAAAVPDTSGTVPVVNLAYIGVGATGTSGHINGHIRRITYYPRRLSNAELQAITA